MACCSTLLSALLWSLVPSTFTALDHTIYDTWLRHRTTAQVSPSLTIVACDSASEDRFGRGPWDRSVLAQLIVAIHEAGATVIGADHRLDYASHAQLGGAASDALFLEALRTASPMVLMHDPDSSLHSDTAMYGHILVTSDLDHVSRRIPSATRIGEDTILAFGSMLSDVFTGTRPCRHSFFRTTPMRMC
ncbi:MAG: CHASE2 domain-containing protein [Nitrospira sp.]